MATVIHTHQRPDTIRQAAVLVAEAHKSLSAAANHSLQGVAMVLEALATGETSAHYAGPQRAAFDAAARLLGWRTTWIIPTDPGYGGVSVRLTPTTAD